MLRTRKCWVTVLTLGAACVAGPARAADIDKLTPADAQAVMVFNIRQAFDSPLAKKKGIVDLVTRMPASPCRRRRGDAA